MTGTVHKKKSLKKAFKKKELEAIRKKLIAEKERIIQDVLALKGDNINKSFKDLSGDLSGYSFHMADMATDLYDREFSLGLAEGERERLYELDEAVKRIDQGNYGICETCGEKIPSGRLKVMPHAKYCLKHQEEMEKEASR
jgi:RNA polymerase-binding protein DksA